jgi:hypothetical protein
MICANCGHSKEAHWDRYGCEVEGPDVWVEGNNCGGLMASGPCGCLDFKEEPMKEFTVYLQGIAQVVIEAENKEAAIQEALEDANFDMLDTEWYATKVDPAE